MTTDEEYMYNWVEKFDMLCESKTKVGLLGSSFFVGILVGLLFVPRLADMYGRKPVFLATMILSSIMQLGFLLCTSIDQACILVAFLGMTFPGRMIVGFNYMLEFTLDCYREFVINGQFLLEIILLLVTVIWC